jgi:biopolymer transport protein TolR
MAMGPILGNERRGRRTPMAEINVTPMVDVMLVLLIIFMVTAPLMVAGVPVDLPDSKAKALDQEVKPVQISLDPTGDPASSSAPTGASIMAA